MATSGIQSVEAILKRLASTVSRISLARYEFGLAVLALIDQHGYSRDAAAARIVEALPDYQVRTGYKLTKAWLLASADRILLHRAAGGIPDGNGDFVVPERDFAESKMPDALATKVALLTASNPDKGPGVLRGKDVRAALTSMANAKTDDDLGKAITALQAKVAKVETERAVLDGSERDLLEHAVTVARQGLERAQAALHRAQDKLKEARAALASYDASTAAAIAEEEPAKAAPKRRQTSRQPRANIARA